MHSKPLISAVLALLAGSSVALPVSVNSTETELSAFNGSTSELHVVTVGATNTTEPSAQLSSRDDNAIPGWWNGKCDFYYKRVPGTVIGNEDNAIFDLESDCSKQDINPTWEHRLPNDDAYVVRINLSRAWHTSTCACDWLHFFLSQKNIADRPVCTSWYDGKGMDIQFKAGRANTKWVNWALEQVYGFRFTCRKGLPKDMLAGHPIVGSV